MTDLARRVAVVTGAGRGIGRAIALGIAPHGASVALVARSTDELRTTADEIRAAGGDATVVAADASMREGVAAVAAALADRDAPTILINAAGVFGPMGLIAESDPDDWMRAVQTNLFSTYLMSRHVLPGMLNAGWGRILNVSSAAALHTPGPLNSAYATSKVAINQFTRHLAAELVGTGVTANALHPGDVRTEMFDDIRRKVDGAADSNYGSWVAWLEETGGDPPSKAVDLVLRVINDERGTPNGEFLWIDNPLQAPVASWEADGADPDYHRD